MNNEKMIKRSFHLPETLNRAALNVAKHHFFATTEAEAYRQLLAFAVRHHSLTPPVE